jgi:hypothetical protein
MRGDYFTRIERFFAALPFSKLGREAIAVDGDIALVAPSPSQLHLVVCAQQGWVHAHAGLRRVVHTPVTFDWPMIAHWRLIGG